MSLKSTFLKKTLAALLTLQLVNLTPLFIPKAHALFWEDEGDENNNPNEVKHRPDHFNMFDWVDDLDRDSKKKTYEEMDNHDRGPGVNGDAQALVLITSGVVGLAGGLLLSYEFSGANDNVTSNMFIGGAIGLGAGLGIGALIMPHDYNVNPIALDNDGMKFRQAWLQDPVRLQVAQAFHPSQVSVQFQF
ncbi:MAG TPA: hypothetical protein VHE12_11980 [bacterium]|nr:hypothetical protein [bacterium]